MSAEGFKRNVTDIASSSISNRSFGGIMIRSNLLSDDLISYPADGRLKLDPKQWSQLVGEFDKLFCKVAGHPQTIASTASWVTQ